MEEQELTVITYNLDSTSICREERLNVFIDQIKKTQPDIIAIQEGNRELYSKLFLAMKNMDYKYHQFQEIFQRKCGEVLFSKLPISEALYQPFQHTEQGRGLSIYTLEVCGHKIRVATSQLECGLRRSPYLRKQIQQINKTMASFEGPAIVLGDFQISSFHADIKEPDGWIDAWEEAGISKEKYSIDSQLNTLAKVQDRPDRVWFIPKDVITCEECRLVGLPIPRQENLFASKHFGVSVRFSIR